MKQITIINCEKKISHNEIESLLNYWFKQFKLFIIRLLHVPKWTSKLPVLIDKKTDVYFLDQESTPVTKRYFLSTFQTFMQCRSNDEITFIIGPSDGFPDDFKRKYFSSANNISLS
ncbi:23S rRNA (pseudouridine(1915)-N(3))-methyltransferase RlmH, partial [Chlamydiia bacterium]|nr:23S rRNA (pseudouridine(1915)-N(3))-methyltransferase RlmH [Chlamydiia bacterium]